MNVRVLISILVVAIIALRKWTSLSVPQFWAEDGAMFFCEADALGWRSLLIPYQGYLHFIPRSIALAASPANALHVPAIYAWLSLACTGLIAWIIQSPRLKIVGSRSFALAIALIPHTGEVFLNLANLQWIAALGLVTVALSEDPKKLTEGLSDIVILIVIGLTGPFICLAAPLFLYRAALRRSTWSTALFLTSCLCVAAHLPSLLSLPPGAHSTVPWNAFHHLSVIGRRTILTWMAHDLEAPRWICASLGGLLLSSLSLGAWNRRRTQPALLGMLFFLFAIFAATTFKANIHDWSLRDLSNGDRYFYIPIVLCTTLCIAIALSASRAISRTIYILLCIICTLAAPRFIVPTFPDLNWPHYAHIIESGKTIEAPILPSGFSFAHPGRKSGNQP